MTWLELNPRLSDRAGQSPGFATTPTPLCPLHIRHVTLSPWWGPPLDVRIWDGCDVGPLRVRCTRGRRCRIPSWRPELAIRDSAGDIQDGETLQQRVDLVSSEPLETIAQHWAYTPLYFRDGFLGSGRQGEVGPP